MIPWLASPLVKIAVLGLGAIGVLVGIKTVVRNYQESVIARAFAEAEAKSMREQLGTIRQQLTDERARVQTLNEQLTAARAAAAARAEVFNRHNLGELVQEKPLMIERRINTATVEVWREIETESREAR
jgi:hypothetical protein